MEKALFTGQLFASEATAAAKIAEAPLPAMEIPLAHILRQGCQLEVSPPLAARILRECRCKYHVAPAQSKVDRLAVKIRAGELRLCRQPLWFGSQDGHLFLLAGWLRLAAVVRSGIPVRFPISVTAVDGQEQLRALARGARQRRSALTPEGFDTGAPAPESGHTPLSEILVHGREVSITPGLAERIEQECRYEYERPLKQWRVDFLVAEIERGGFEQGRQISFALLNGRLIRINGQHRLKAVAITGGAQTFMVEVKPVVDEHQLAALYATYDTEGRTLPETAGPLMKAGNLGKEQVATLLRSVQFIYTGFRKPDDRQAATMRSHVMRNQLAALWYPYAERYFALTEQAPGNSKAALRRQSVAGVALYTLRFQPEKAGEFWQGIAMDDGLRRTDPRKSLLEKLRSGDGARSIVFQMHAVAAAWNAFFERRQLKEVQVRIDKPFRIAGTPVMIERLSGDIEDA